MQQTQANRPLFPQVPLVGAAILVAFSLTAASYGRIAGLGTPKPVGTATAERTLRFADRADGAVVITLAGSGRVVDVMTGQNGFLRGTLRGFARTRRESGIGQEPPMRLTGYADGRLVLFDPATQRQVELEAFGSANEAVFVRLLTMKPRDETASAAPKAGGI
jgi:putative photosynthetic complex assembly protein